jgi:hypothetical protein
MFAKADRRQQADHYIIDALTPLEGSAPAVFNRV